MENYEGMLIGLVDDEGNELNFELIDKLELNGVEYVALVPEFDNSQELVDSDGELVVLKVVEDEELGEETFVTIDDEDEFNEVVAAFEKRFEEGEDFELLQ